MWIKGNRDAINTDYLMSLNVRTLDGYSDSGTLTATTMDGQAIVLADNVLVGCGEQVVEDYFQALAEGWPIFDIMGDLGHIEVEGQLYTDE